MVTPICVILCGIKGNIQRFEQSRWYEYQVRGLRNEGKVVRNARRIACNVRWTVWNVWWTVFGRCHFGWNQVYSNQIPQNRNLISQKNGTMKLVWVNSYWNWAFYPNFTRSLGKIKYITLKPPKTERNKTGKWLLCSDFGWN